MKTILNRSHALRSGLRAVGAAALIGGASLASGPSARAQDAGGGGKSVTIGPAVSGTVTVDVNQVPFDTALQAVLGGANPPLVAPLVNGIYQAQVDVPAPAPAPTNVAPGGVSTSASGDQNGYGGGGYGNQGGFGGSQFGGGYRGF